MNQAGARADFCRRRDACRGRRFPQLRQGTLFTPFLFCLQDTDRFSIRPGSPPMTNGSPSRRGVARYLGASALCILTTLATVPLRDLLDVANIVMIFLLTVFATAVWLGRGPAVLAAFLGVLLFDFFFVPPHLSLAVADAQYLVTFAVMLAVGLITSQLAARLSQRIEEAQSREQDTRVLYQLARDLGGALTVDRVAEITQGFLDRLEIDVTVLVADTRGDGSTFHEFGSHHLQHMEKNFARTAYQQGTIIETDTLVGMGVAIVFLPLLTSTKTQGVLALAPRSDDAEIVRLRLPLLEAVASLVGIALERFVFADAAKSSELEVAAERLRTSILSSLSHDLRTPLTSLVGLADALVQRQPPLSDSAAETAGIIRDQARAMHHLLSNLLEMARLQAGRITLNKEWQPLEEIVGSSSRLLAVVLADRRLEIQIPRDLPLVHFDAVLMERVLCNLLENAAKFSPAGAKIKLLAHTQEQLLVVAVDNEGSGFPAGRIDHVFELFARGECEPAVSGTGMGLAICKAIVEAHGGTIGAANRCGGACVQFTLPLGTPPPAIEEESLS